MCVRRSALLVERHRVTRRLSTLRRLRHLRRLRRLSARSPCHRCPCCRRSARSANPGSLSLLRLCSLSLLGSLRRLLYLRLHRLFRFRMFHNGTHGLFIRLNRCFERFDHLLVFGSKLACGTVCGLCGIRVDILCNFHSVVGINVRIFYGRFNNIRVFFRLYWAVNRFGLNGLLNRFLNGFRSRGGRSAVRAKRRTFDDFLTAIRTKHYGTSLESELLLTIKDSQRVSNRVIGQRDGADCTRQTHSFVKRTLMYIAPGGVAASATHMNLVVELS